MCIISIIRVPKLREISQTDPGCKMPSMRLILPRLTAFRDHSIKRGMVCRRVFRRHAERLPSDNEASLQLVVQQGGSKKCQKRSPRKDIFVVYTAAQTIRHVSRSAQRNPWVRSDK